MIIKMKENKKKKLIDKILEENKNIKHLNTNNENKYYTFECEKKHIFNIPFVILIQRNSFKTKICTVCNPIDRNFSGLENQMSDFIKDNYTGTILENKKIINSFELDVYLPDLKLAFEFNGLYWHSEIYKENNYHLNKTEECEKQGIKLIHIFEDQWMYKKDIVKSRILNLLCKSEKIFARKCEIKEIYDNKQIKYFLEKNHLQGFVGSKIKLGLFFNGELVSLMTFGSFRKSMGTNSIENSYEMLRFCNKLNINVIGGASKLFNYFVKNYKPIEVISYADRNWSNGNLYEKLGFKLSHKTQPNYYYIIDGHRKYRFGFRKDL
jgi:very-short-patch-repair endonuclease